MITVTGDITNMKVYIGNITGRLVIEATQILFVSANNNGPLLSMSQECWRWLESLVLVG